MYHKIDRLQLLLLRKYHEKSLTFHFFKLFTSHLKLFFSVLSSPVVRNNTKKRGMNMRKQEQIFPDIIHDGTKVSSCTLAHPLDHGSARTGILK